MSDSRKIPRQSVTVRRIGPEFHDWILGINAANVPEVGSMDHAGLMERLAMPHWLGAAFMGDRPVGVLLGMREGAAYRSPNYLWFNQRYDRFIYVDRIMIDEAARGLGAGRALYDRFVEDFADDAQWLFCEVNTLPPNPQSLRFHDSLGMMKISDLVHVPGEKAVAMLGRCLRSRDG